MEKRKVTKLPRRFSAFFMAMVMVLSLLVGISTTSYADAEFIYDVEADGTTISATCQDPQGGGDIVYHKTITEPTDLEYTGNAIEAEVSPWTLQGETNSEVAAPSVAGTVTYTAHGDAVLTEGKPVLPGDYTATLIVEGEMADVLYTITKRQLTLSPSNFTVSNPTSAGAHDGSITISSIPGNVTLEMMSPNGSDYTDVESTSITGLGAGHYVFRVKASNTDIQSQDFGVILADPQAPAQLEYTAGSGSTANVITATKGNQTATYTLTADDVVWSSDLQYDGAAVDIQGSVDGAPTAEDAKALITYKKGDETVTISGDSIPGTYTAVLTLGGVTATKEFTIKKIDGPAAPTGLAGVAPTTAAGNNGKITGVNDDMEYKLADATNYTAVEANAATITGLTAGTYKVRYKSKTFVEAGADATVTINPYQAGAQVVVKPENPSAPFTYDGTEKRGLETNAAWVISSGTPTATAIGNYTATATLKQGYVWSDGSIAPVVIQWSIAARPVHVQWTHLYVDKGEIYEASSRSENINWNDEVKPEAALNAVDVLRTDKTSEYVNPGNLGLTVKIYESATPGAAEVDFDDDTVGVFTAKATLTGTSKDNYVICDDTDNATFTVVDSRALTSVCESADHFFTDYSSDFPAEASDVSAAISRYVDVMGRIAHQAASQEEIDATTDAVVTALNAAKESVKAKKDYRKACDEVYALLSKEENQEKYSEIMKALDNPEDGILGAITVELYGTSTSPKTPTAADFVKATAEVKKAFEGAKNAIAFIEAAKKLPAAGKVTLEDVESVSAVCDIYEKIPDVFVDAMLKNKDHKKLVENFEAVVTKLNELIKADEEAKKAAEEAAKKAAEEEAKKNAKIEVPSWVNYKGNIVAVDKNGKLVKKTGIATWKGHNFLIANGVLYKKPAFFLDKSTGTYKYFVNGIQAKTGDTFVYYGGKLLRVTNGEFNQEAGFVKFGGKYYISYKGVAATFFTGTLTVKGYKIKVVKGAVVGISK